MTHKKETNDSSIKAGVYSRRKFLGTSLVGIAGLALTGCQTAELEEQTAEAVVNNPTATATNPPATATPLPTATATDVATNNDPTATPTEPPTATSTNTPTHTPQPPLDPTPACDDHDETIAQTAGPFYAPNTPQRTSLVEAGMVGPRLVVTGRVMTTDCQPLPGAILDFWHADEAGDYDNEGYRLRGHQFTDGEGRYHLETIIPGLYTGRTRHIHVRVQGQNTALLTTQIYFPDEPDNADDSIFHSSLVMDIQPAADGSQAAVFDFVLEG
ncbi:MAG: dioxygenase [Chloroflexota bacterium]